MLSTTVIRRARRLAAAGLLAAAMAAGPATVYADDASALADNVESEQATADKAQDAVDAAEADPTTANVNAAIAVLSADGPAPSYTFDGVSSQASTQFLFAQLQMQLSLQAKQEAAQKLEEIKAQQEREQELASVIQELRILSSKASTTDTVDLSSDLAARIQALGVSATAGKVTKTQIDTVIASLEEEQDRIESSIQTQMVYVQDFLGQYNSYLQGSQSSIQSANETLKAVARGTVDEGDAASSTISDLTALASSINDQLETKRAELEEALANQADGDGSTSVKDLFDQYDSLVEQQSLVSEQLASALASTSASGTTEGASGDAFGMAALRARARATPSCAAAPARVTRSPSPCRRRSSSGRRRWSPPSTAHGTTGPPARRSSFAS